MDSVHVTLKHQPDPPLHEKLKAAQVRIEKELTYAGAYEQGKTTSKEALTGRGKLVWPFGTLHFEIRFSHTNEWRSDCEKRH